MMDHFRVLTVWQPYATLLVYGIKGLETRPAPTSWTAEKGAYLIHAASKWTKEQELICFQEPFKSALIDLGYILPVTDDRKFCMWKKAIPFGAIIGSVEVASCHTIHNEQFDLKLKPKIYKGFNDYLTKPIWQYIDEPERSFGDYTHRRSAWICQNPKQLINPIPYKGGQGYYQKFHGDESQLIFK